MKPISLILSAIVISASGFLIKVPIVPQTPIITPNADWIQRQRLILSFFNNVCDLSNDPMIIRLSEEFNFEASSANYTDVNVVLNLKNLISGKGILPKGQIFTEYNKDHLAELKIISELLCSARDFDTFLKAAAWARQNVNCGLFVDAIYMAVIKRRDTEKLSIPAPYELLPNYFIKKNAIITGSSLLTGTPISSLNSVRNDGNAYIIEANYTSDIFDNDDDTKLAYFHEDIGLNSYFFFKKLSKIYWLNDLQNEDSRYGEYVYHMMKQLATRYDLERYSNEFEDVPGFKWNVPNFVTYNPMLMYSNGNDFASRSKAVDFTNTEEFTLLNNIEQNIAAVVSHMRQSAYDKRLIMNNLMEILLTGDKNYETLTHQLLERLSNSSNGSVSVLEHYMTSLRDPLFWQINKKIVNLIETALNVLPTYSKNELYFPGVQIVNIDIKAMSTYYDNYEFDATDALRAVDNNCDFQVKISQPRLNHKPFSMKVNITSFVAQKGLLKVYLGPKMLPGELVAKKNKFMLLDIFEVNLKKGTNIIKRSSDEIASVSSDLMSLKTIYNNVENAEFGVEMLSLNDIEKLTSFPSRLIIPKGSVEGLPFQIFVFVAPFVKISIDAQGLTSMDFNSAVLSPGYPLDLNIENWQLFDLPNVMVKEITVTHKESSKSGNYDGGAKKWDGENSYDYSSKKSQYGKQTDYASKRFESQPYTEEKKITTEKQFDDTDQSKEKFSQESDNKNEKNMYLTSDFLDNVDKKIDKAVISLFDKDSNNTLKKLIDSRLEHPLSLSTKKFEKYKNITKDVNKTEKNAVKAVIKPIVNSKDTVVLNNNTNKLSKTLSESDLNDVSQLTTNLTKTQGTDVTLDTNYDTWSKIISKNYSKDIVKPIIHPAGVTLDNKETKWNKNIIINDATELGKSFVHPRDVNIDGQWSKTIRKSDPDVLKPFYNSNGIVIDNDDENWSKTIYKSNPTVTESFLHTTTVEIEKPDTFNSRPPINKENRPTVFDYVLNNYFDYQDPIYE